MPEAEGRISEKGKLEPGFSAAAMGKDELRNGGTLETTAELARLRRKSRRRWRSRGMLLFGIGGTWFGDANPVVGEGRMKIGELDCGHVSGGAIFFGPGGGGAREGFGFFFLRG